MEKKLYVGNLSFNATEGDLKELFGKHGEVATVSIITDRYTGRSRGFAFVEMETPDGAQKASQALNGKEFKTRELVVNFARPQSKDGGGRDGGNRERNFNR